MTLLIFFFVLSILFSFLCSIWEAVLLSITPSFVNIKSQENHPLAGDLHKMKEDIDRPLSAILTLNTIAHTVGAIGVGAQAGKVFGHNEIGFGNFHLSYESIIAALMTLAILILSEIIPKTLGANSWKSLWSFTIRSIKLLLFVLAPLVLLSQLITKSLKEDKEKSVLSRADFAAMTQVGEQEGVLDEKESAIIGNLLYFENLTVKDIMTPRPVVVAEDQNISLKEFHDSHKNLTFSRIPVYRDKIDDVTGFVLKSDILENIIEGKGDLKLNDIKRDIQFLNESLSLSDFFDTQTKNKTHLSMVVDEYGAVIGLVSLEDLFETLLGMEIMDELDNIQDMQKYARQQWEKRAKLRQ